MPAILPALRLLLVWDNLQGHLTPALVLWLFSHGVMPLYTPLSGPWLNMAESIQRIVSRRALAGQYPQTPQQIIDALESTVKGWNQDPTPFHWGGKRHARRLRSRQRQHALTGSGGPGSDSVNLVNAIDSWVTQETGPGQLTASKRNPDGSTAFTRPLSQHPQYPRYTGPANDANTAKQASSYTCTSPAS